MRCGPQSRKAKTQMQNTEIRAPMEGILSDIKAIDGEFVNDGNELLDGFFAKKLRAWRSERRRHR